MKKNVRLLITILILTYAHIIRTMNEEPKNNMTAEIISGHFVIEDKQNQNPIVKQELVLQQTKSYHSGTHYSSETVSAPTLPVQLSLGAIVYGGIVKCSIIALGIQKSLPCENFCSCSETWFPTSHSQDCVECCFNGFAWTGSLCLIGGLAGCAVSAGLCCSTERWEKVKKILCCKK